MGNWYPGKNAKKFFDWVGSGINSLSITWDASNDYLGDYAGNDKDARSDERLWDIIQGGQSLIDQGYALDIEDLNQRKDYFAEDMGNRYENLGMQSGQQSFNAGAGYRQNQANAITGQDEANLDYINKQIKNQYMSGTENLSLQRREQESKFANEETGFGLERDRGYYEGFLTFEQERKNTKHDPTGGAYDDFDWGI